MSNFLFRGFCPDENGTQIAVVDGVEYKGEWVEGEVQTIWGKKYIYNCQFSPPSIPVIPETVSQWTGLTDRNGKKIFEKDIVTCDIGNGTLPIRRLLNRTGIVKYERHFYALEITNRFGIADDGKEDFCDKRVSFGAVNNLEVIGTIFDKEEV